MLMKKILSMMSLVLMLLAFGWAQTATAKTVYLQPNDWTNDNARLALYVWGVGENNNAWVEFSASAADGIYVASFDEANYSEGMIITRLDPSQEIGWDAKWNQTGNLAVPTADNQLYTISGWDGVTVGNGITVSDLYTYTVDFETKVTTTVHDFAVASNWGHIVDTYEDYYGDTAYPSYSYSDGNGVDGTRGMSIFTDQNGNGIYDMLVTPLVSGLVTIYAKPMYSSYLSTAFVEFWSLNDDATEKVSRLAVTNFTDASVFTPVTVYLSTPQRIGIRASRVYFDNFMAQEATIVPEKKLSITGISVISGSTPVICNQQEDGSAVVSANVKLENTGDVDLVAGETENYSLTFAWKQYYGSTVTPCEDVTFNITENLAVGETKTIETTFTIPSEVASAIFTNQSSGYFYLKVRENVTGKVGDAELQCQLKKYESKFIFDKEGTSYYSSSSATTTPIDFGKINEATTVGYEIYNSGSAPLTINSFTLPEPFTSDAPATPFIVAGGEKKVIAITMPFTDPGIYSGNLVINYTNFGKEAADYTLGISGTILDASKNLITFSNADNSNGQYPEGSIHSDQVYISYNSSSSNYYLQSTSTTTKFITGLMTAEAGESFTYDAWYSQYNSSAAVTVYSSTDRVNWTQIAKETYSTGIGSTMKTFTATIAEAGDYYLAFELAGNALLDNIYGLTLAATPEHDWYITEDATVPTTGTQNKDYTATIKVKNISAEADNLTATLYMDGEAVASEAVTLAGNAMTAAEGTGRPGTYGMSNIAEPNIIELTFRPHTTGTLPAYIELKAGDYVLTTAEVQVTIAEEKAESDLAMESNGTSGSSPLNLNYNNSESVSLYTADVLTNKLGLKAGDKISSITFKAYKTAVEHQTLLSVYYEWTDDTQQAAPSNNGLLDVTGMTAYMENELYTWETKGSSSELEDMLVLNFEDPLVYEAGKALRIVVRSLNQSTGSNYKQVYWEKSTIYQNPSVSGTYLNYRHYTDTSGERDSETNYTTSFTASWGYEYLPAIHLGLVVETPKLFGTVNDVSKDTPLPLAGAKVTIRNTENDVEYTGITDENGNYCIDIIQKDLVYDEFFCELDGYATESYTERYHDAVTFNPECDLWLENYPFTDEETVTGCFWNFGMYPCVELTISESTWATFYYEMDTYEVPEGLTAYTAVKDGNTISLTERGHYIPAGCAVVINGEPGTYQFKWSDNSTSFTGDNSLVGSEEGGKYDEAGYKYYVLSWKNKNKNVDEVGFYFQSGSKGKYAKVKAHQAFIRVPSSQANDAGYTFTYDAGTTDISNVENADTMLDPNQPMYNLAGQRVGKDYRGVVIQNGKKIIKK